ncbi:MAG: transporter substrate-binding domain-containing protein [Propionivibrio sp.]|nr:transporter substrate-binding domain-containing protein [Propionivibrio sp.]
MLLVVAVAPCAEMESRAGHANGGRTLTVVMDDNYPPYVFRDSSGMLDGYLVDLWKLWESKTGVRVDLVATDWQKAQQLMADGQADVIDTMFMTQERQRTLRELNRRQLVVGVGPVGEGEGHWGPRGPRCGRGAGLATRTGPTGSLGGLISRRPTN